MKFSGKLKYHLLAIVTIIVWGVSYPNTRILLDASLSPTEIYVYRFIIAYIGLVACSRFRFSMCPWRDELRMALLGLTGGTAYFIAQNVALDMTLVSNVAILVDTTPLFTVMLAAIFLKDEHFTWQKAAGSLLAFVGVAMLTFRHGFVWGSGIVGDMLAIGAAIAWAVYSIILRRLNNRYSTLLITRKTFFYGIVTSLPILLAQGHFTPAATLTRPMVAGNLLFLALICSMAAFFAWGRVTKELGAIRANNYIYLGPIVTMTVAAAFLGERVGIVGLTGCAIILAGIILADRPHHPSTASEDHTEAADS
ncbi:MAG: DMT family transporter [Muribaculaceae bacterium]|nr:DMT family transporter [Muribaculaceae bacterium]